MARSSRPQKATGGTGRSAKGARTPKGGRGPKAARGSYTARQTKLPVKGKSQQPARPAAHERAGNPAGLDWIEGRRAVAEALLVGLPLRRALIGAGGDPTLAALVERLEAAGVPVSYAPRTKLDELSSHGAHQGIVAEATPYAYAALDDIVQRASGAHELVVVLDHVTDEGNFGAIVRSCEVVGAAGVIIPKARAAKVGTAAYKTSAGAVLHVPIAQVSNIARALDDLKAAGFWVAGATEHATQLVWDAPFEGRIALVMGSEGEGISRLVAEKCDFMCKLPQRGSVESLNVAQAATVLSYEWLRRNWGAEG